MFGPFGSYVIPWYSREIDRLESLSPANENARRDILLRIADMLVELDDLSDEGNTALSAEFDTHHNARARLNILFDRFYKAQDEHSLNPLPRADRLVAGLTNDEENYASPLDLSSYLAHLSTITFDDVDDEIRSGESYKAWREGVSLILMQQSAFAKSIFSQKFDCLVTLLRDMLPQYLLAIWNNIPAAAIPLGRSYLDRFGPGYEAYDQISDALYKALRSEPDDFNRMWSCALDGMRNNIEATPCMSAIAAALKNECAGNIPTGRLLIVESGLQATMPLLFEAIFPEADKWHMFTAAPWLLDVYRDRLFCHQYALLRPCETLFCTDKLFRVVFKEGGWYAQESLDRRIKALAYWEIAALRDLNLKTQLPRSMRQVSG